ncbi:hypothetical protein LZK76_36920 (plasmid) [Rhizobium leguminosarum]|nr:hypothetical protein LZK76_36920 [Rhizobium leguminosarum]
MHQIKRLLTLAAVLIAVTSPALAHSLVVYSPQGEENVQWIVDQAKAAGHDVQVLRAPGGGTF